MRRTTKGYSREAEAQGEEEATLDGEAKDLSWDWRAGLATQRGQDPGKYTQDL